MPGGLLSLKDFSPYQFSALLDLALEIKNKPARYCRRLENQIAGWVAGPEKSFPVEPSFQTAVAGLGGDYIPCPFPSPRRDSLFVLKHLEKWMNCVLAGAFPHSQIMEWERRLIIPVINTGSDIFNPCRALADLFTLKEFNLDLNSLRLAYIGGRTPVLNSLIQGLAKTGAHLHIACPKNLKPDENILDPAGKEGKETGFSLTVGHDPGEAALDADVLYTDCGWQENASGTDAEKFRITSQLVRNAGSRVIVLHGHSLTAGEEIERRVIEGLQSAVLKQWENTLHIQKAIMVSLLKVKK